MGPSHAGDDVEGARRACRRLGLPQVRELPAVGAFKFRGAMNAVLQLSEAERRNGVITHSSGNHAQAVALAGKLVGVPVTVVMPRNAPAVKRAATEGYGARIVSCEPTFRSREDTVAAEIERHGFTLVHPFDDWNVIAGQGTAALELLEDAGPLDLVICPVGGGGLLAGTALAVEGRGRLRLKVMAGEPANADDARRSLEAGADPGLRRPGDHRRRPAHDVDRPAEFRRDQEPRQQDRRGLGAGDRRGDAVRLGTRQDRDRAVERRRGRTGA